MLVNAVVCVCVCVCVALLFNEPSNCLSMIGDWCLVNLTLYYSILPLLYPIYPRYIQTLMDNVKWSEKERKKHFLIIDVVSMILIFLLYWQKIYSFGKTSPSPLVNTRNLKPENFIKWKCIFLVFIDKKKVSSRENKVSKSMNSINERRTRKNRNLKRRSEQNWKIKLIYQKYKFKCLVVIAKKTIFFAG